MQPAKDYSWPYIFFLFYIRIYFSCLIYSSILTLQNCFHLNLYEFWNDSFHALYIVKKCLEKDFFEHYNNSWKSSERIIFEWICAIWDDFLYKNWCINYFNPITRIKVLVFTEREKEKTENMVENDIRIFQKMKNKGSLCIRNFF